MIVKSGFCRGNVERKKGFEVWMCGKFVHFVHELVSVVEMTKEQKFFDVWMSGIFVHLDYEHSKTNSDRSWKKRYAPVPD